MVFTFKYQEVQLDNKLSYSATMDNIFFFFFLMKLCFWRGCACERDILKLERVRQEDGLRCWTGSGLCGKD